MNRNVPISLSQLVTNPQQFEGHEPIFVDLGNSRVATLCLGDRRPSFPGVPVAMAAVTVSVSGTFQGEVELNFPPENSQYLSRDNSLHITCITLQNEDPGKSIMFQRLVNILLEPHPNIGD